MNHVYDITVIGGGPVGMFATFYAGLKNADVHLIESLPQLGGQVGALYPEKEIFDIAGFPEIKGKDLISQLEAQIATFTPKISLNTSVQMINHADGIFEIETNQATYYSKAVIIATGNGAFAPRRLAVDYDHALDGQYVNYFVNDLSQFKDCDVAIAGGGDSAVDWALALNKIAASVTIIHRRDRFRCLESNFTKMQAEAINIKTPFLVDHLALEHQKLAVGLKKSRSEDHEVLYVDKLLVNYGFTSDSRILKKWAVELVGPDIKVNQHMQSSRPLIYSVGDTNTYEGKVKLIAAGFGEVPTAVNHALENIYPDRKQPLHSTSLMENR